MRSLTIAVLSVFTALAVTSGASAQTNAIQSDPNNVHSKPAIGRSAADEPWQYHPCMANVVTSDGRHVCLND
jgi:hypothetical protein